MGKASLHTTLRLLFLSPFTPSPTSVLQAPLRARNFEGGTQQFNTNTHTPDTLPLRAAPLANVGDANTPFALRQVEPQRLGGKNERIAKRRKTDSHKEGEGQLMVGKGRP